MADDSPTRDEINARLEAVEARLDSKLSGIAADITVMSHSVERIGVDVVGVRSEVRTENRSTRRTMIVTGIVVAVAIVAAMWQMQTGLQGL